MRHWIFILLCGLASGALANDWGALDAPGAHAIMRHALAPGTGDPANFDVTDCSTQRNLDVRGQTQAHQIGKALRYGPSRWPSFTPFLEYRRVAID